MPVVDAPAWNAWPPSAPGSRPEGNFVLMKIDPVASVAIFEDEETTRAAAALERHEWVLGLVTDSPPGLPDANGNESMSLRIDLIGQGPPKDKPIASLPFAPSPQLYEDRPPIELQPRLPWPNLYLHTYYSSSVLISRIHFGSGYFPVTLTEDEYDPIVSRAFDDRVDWHNLPPVTVEEQSAVMPAVQVAGSFAPSGSFHPSQSSDDSSSDKEDSLYAQQREDMGMKLLKARIYAEISLDPATCPGPLGCPVDMEEPVTRIRELWASWQERATVEILAKRPITDAWIQGVEAARHERESEPEQGGNAMVQPEDDELLLPGDAVDEQSAGGVDTRPPTPSPATPAVAVDLAPAQTLATSIPPSELGPQPAVPSLVATVGDHVAEETANANVLPPAAPAASAVKADSSATPLGLVVTSGPSPAKDVPVRARVFRLADRIRPLVVRAKAAFKVLTRKPRPSLG